VDEADGDGGNSTAGNRRGPTSAVASDDVQYLDIKRPIPRHANTVWVKKRLHKTNNFNLPGIRYGRAVIDRDRDDRIAHSDDIS